MSARKGIGGYLGLEPYAGEPYHVGVALEIMEPSKSIVIKLNISLCLYF